MCDLGKGTLCKCHQNSREVRRQGAGCAKPYGPKKAKNVRKLGVSKMIYHLGGDKTRRTHPEKPYKSRGFKSSP